MSVLHRGWDYHMQTCCVSVHRHIYSQGTHISIANCKMKYNHVVHLAMFLSALFEKGKTSCICTKCLCVQVDSFEKQNNPLKFFQSSISCLLLTKLLNIKSWITISFLSVLFSASSVKDHNSNSQWQFLTIKAIYLFLIRFEKNYLFFFLHTIFSLFFSFSTWIFWICSNSVSSTRLHRKNWVYLLSHLQQDWIY